MYLRKVITTSILRVPQARDSVTVPEFDISILF